MYDIEVGSLHETRVECSRQPVASATRWLLAGGGDIAMKFIEKSKLRKLLISQANPFLRQIGAGTLMNYSVGKLDRKKAINVYSIKEELSQNRYETFPALIAGLKLLDDKYVKIHTLNCSSRDFVIFTDVSVQNLIGYVCPSTK